ncbi:MAG: hypothetical protein ACRCT6_03225 [Notoacmeibacter sp.]
MILELPITKAFDVHYLLVCAPVRYWEDATVNGVEDADGVLIPCRRADHWRPVIDLETGHVINWNQGAEAEIHYKVAYLGEYFLLDAAKLKAAKYRSNYVPDMLSIGENGYGDFIIMHINSDGFIKGWKPPRLDQDQWQVI